MCICVCARENLEKVFFVDSSFGLITVQFDIFHLKICQIREILYLFIPYNFFCTFHFTKVVLFCVCTGAWMHFYCNVAVHKGKSCVSKKSEQLLCNYQTNHTLPPSSLQNCKYQLPTDSSLFNITYIIVRLWLLLVRAVIERINSCHYSL